MPPLRHVPQRGPWDCGVASLASLLGVEYEEAERAIALSCGRLVPIRGMKVQELICAAAFLGRTVWRQVPFDPYTSRGIGSFRGHAAHGAPWWHFAPMDAGVVLDPESHAWLLDDYLEATGGRLCSLLVEPVSAQLLRAA